MAEGLPFFGILKSQAAEQGKAPQVVRLTASTLLAAVLLNPCFPARAEELQPQQARRPLEPLFFLAEPEEEEESPPQMSFLLAEPPARLAMATLPHWQGKTGWTLLRHSVSLAEEVHRPAPPPRNKAEMVANMAVAVAAAEPH